MRWGRIQLDERPRYVVVQDDKVILVDGSPFEQWKQTKQTIPIEDANFLTPCTPLNFYGVGRNYPTYLKKMGIPKPNAADVGYRSVSSLVPHKGDIVIPKDAPGPVHPEGELVVVIGKVIRNATPETAVDGILGYSILNDVTERTWLKEDRTIWRAKNCDTFAPFGPWIETDVGDPQNLSVVTRVNRNEVCGYNTETMLFSISEYIERISRYCTLHPRDILAMGSDGGGDALVKLEAGDSVEIEIERIGTLRNSVKRAL